MLKVIAVAKWGEEVERENRARPPPPIEPPPIIKRMTTKPISYSVSVSFRIFAYNSIINNNISIDDPGARSPSIQIFVNQLKYTE